jgi:hypothetical protein
MGSQKSSGSSGMQRPSMLIIPVIELKSILGVWAVAAKIKLFILTFLGNWK